MLQLSESLLTVTPAPLSSSRAAAEKESDGGGRWEAVVSLVSLTSSLSSSEMRLKVVFEVDRRPCAAAEEARLCVSALSSNTIPFASSAPWIAKARLISLNAKAMHATQFAPQYNNLKAPRAAQNRAPLQTHE
eukprot:CAMPEP_0173109342 /NCGR_PEP_ID=MMETSP1102-20130122/43405_1 /TAXON_ID=49646 /ORGANISM="Geminigera sp., Strain Caron Lab Isolate" /LENGTH=132 /DNA_ID=CAMNT_0014008283 /DNA_START=238 /DNA_END=637 /DNA_ORIENTATION=+